MEDAYDGLKSYLGNAWRAPNNPPPQQADPATITDAQEAADAAYAQYVSYLGTRGGSNERD